jgi:hypothetical protein
VADDQPSFAALFLFLLIRSYLSFFARTRLARPHRRDNGQGETMRLLMPFARVALVLGVAASVPGVLEASPAQDSRDAKGTGNDRSLTTLLGCVAAPAGREKAFSLSELEGGERYLLQGVDVRDFVGKRVEISGSPNRRRLVIRGGLYPNANMAGQAGDIDPTRAAMAAQAGPEANTPRPTQEFRVRSVRLVEGGCPDPQPVRK